MDESEKPNMGLRFFAGAVLFVPFVYSMASCLKIPSFEQVFAELLNGAKLPAATIIVLRGFPVLTLVPPVVFAGTCLILFLSKRREFPFYMAGIGFIVLVILSLFVFLGLSLAFFEIIKQMNQ